MVVVAAPLPCLSPALFSSRPVDRRGRRASSEQGVGTNRECSGGRQGKARRKTENMQTRGKKVREISENEQQERGGEGMKDAQEEGGEQVAQKRGGKDSKGTWWLRVRRK